MSSKTKAEQICKKGGNVNAVCDFLRTMVEYAEVRKQLIDGYESISDELKCRTVKVDGLRIKNYRGKPEVRCATDELYVAMQLGKTHPEYLLRNGRLRKRAVRRDYLNNRDMRAYMQHLGIYLVRKETFAIDTHEKSRYIAEKLIEL